MDREESKRRRAEAKRRYSQSEKGKQVHKAAMQRYLATDAGKQAQQRALARYKQKQHPPEAVVDNHLRIVEVDIDKSRSINE